MTWSEFTAISQTKSKTFCFGGCLPYQESRGWLAERSREPISWQIS